MFQKLSWDQIKGYKNSKTIEGLNLEYKDNNPNTNEDRFFESLLDDICAFSNGSGGHIILGANEARSDTKRDKLGYIGDFSFYKISDFENLKAKINNKISNCIRPKIFYCDIYPLKEEDYDQYLVAIQIGSSINKPHMVHGSGKFHIRTSSGNQLMDIDRIKSQIIDNESMERKIDSFHTERLFKIMSKELSTPSKDYDSGILIHVIPLSSLSRLSDKVPPKLIQEKLTKNTLSIFKKFSESALSIIEHKYNLEGLFIYPEINGSKINKYIQFFKNGIVEKFYPYIKTNSRISARDVKKEISFIRECVDYYNDLEFPISGGAIIFISIFGIKDCSLSCVSNYPEHFYSKERFNFDRNILTLNESISDFCEEEIEKVIKNLCDEIAHASGFETFST